MKFFFRSDGPPARDFAAVQEALEAGWSAAAQYAVHLQKIGPALPVETRSFALQPWYADPTCKDCPHDSWLREVRLVAGKGQERSVDLHVTVLGAFHDRLLRYKYDQVTEMSVSLEKAKPHMGDWLHDEFDVTGDGRVSHEILWQHGAPWRVVAERVHFEVEMLTAA